MKSPRFLDLADVLEIHQSRIDLYGGSAGIRALGMLQSAIAQPEAGMSGEFLHKIYTKWQRHTGFTLPVIILFLMETSGQRRFERDCHQRRST